MTGRNKVRMLRVNEDVWERLMRMKLDLKKRSVGELIVHLLKLVENVGGEKVNLPKINKADKPKEVEKEEKAGERTLTAG